MPPRYFVAFLVEEEVQALPETPNGIGVDIGLKDLAVTSEGERIGNPRPLYRAQRRLKRAQRILSRRKKGSANWHRQRREVARLNARVADVRRDLLHNASAQLVQGAGLIAIEDLNVAGMMKSRRLAKVIGDASFGELRRPIQYKAGWYKREVVVIDHWSPSSKACSGCGHVLPELPLSVRSWTCPVCGAEHDRDVNAARNLLAWATGRVPGTRNDAVEPLKPRRPWPRERSVPMDGDEARTNASPRHQFGTGVERFSGGLQVKYGFPREAAGRVKRVQGLQTGDLVRLDQPKGNYAGTHVERLSGIRTSGRFDIRTTTGPKVTAPWNCFTLLQRGDGYARAA